MNIRNLVSAAALALAASCANTPEQPVSLEQTGEDLSLPSKEHAFLQAFVGNWSVEATFWADAQETMVLSGSANYSWVLGGRFLRQDFRSEIQGAPFTGLGYWGFSRNTGKYQSSWMDTLTTNLSFSDDGVLDADGKTFTSTDREFLDPSRPGKQTKVKDVLVLESPERHVFSRYLLGRDGEHLSMRLIYTR